MLPAISSATDQHDELDQHRDELGDDDREDQVLVRELHLLDQPGATLHVAHRHADRDREEVERQQAAQEVEREVLEAARVADRRRLVEHVQEDDREDHHLRQRVQQAPRPAEDRLLVASAQLLQRQQVQQVAVRQRRSKCHAGESVPTGPRGSGA